MSYYTLFRSLTRDDEPLVWRMLMYASHEATVQAVMSQPYLAMYAKGWGRANDMGIAAIKLDSNEALGVAWLRLWTNVDKGFGFVDYTIPELAMAVLPGHQGRGIGTQILSQSLEVAQADFPAVSLNVRADNPVVGLYQRAGFVKIEGSEIINRTGSVSFNMIKSFVC